jgi:hypothetical protein
MDGTEQFSFSTGNGRKEYAPVSSPAAKVLHEIRSNFRNLSTENVVFHGLD